MSEDLVNTYTNLIHKRLIFEVKHFEKHIHFVYWLFPEALTCAKDKYDYTLVPKPKSLVWGKWTLFLSHPVGGEAGAVCDFCHWLTCDHALFSFRSVSVTNVREYKSNAKIRPDRRLVTGCRFACS